MNYAQAILKNCEAQSLTLALAESCTGGNLAAAFTKILGASKSFLGSLVTYQNNIKTQRPTYYRDPGIQDLLKMSPRFRSLERKRLTSPQNRSSDHSELLKE